MDEKTQKALETVGFEWLIEQDGTRIAGFAFESDARAAFGRLIEEYPHIAGDFVLTRIGEDF